MDDNSESKLFLLKYFTPQSVKIKLDLLKLNIDLENGNPDDDEIIENKNIVSQSIPLLFEIVSLIWKNKKIESPNKNTNTNNDKYILNTFNITYVITEHIKSWNMIDQNDQQKLQISISTVKIIKSLSGINHLKTFILESFQNPHTNSKNKNKSDTDGIKLSFLEFCNSPEPTNIRGKNNLKRKPKNISSPAPKVLSENTRAHLSSEFILPIDIAFDLFVALNNDNNVNDENEKEGNDEYQIKIFNIIENIYANTFSTEKNDEKLDILEGSWTVNSGMETVDSEIIINTLIQTFHFRTMCAIKAATGGDKDILNNLISWVKNNLLPYLIKTNTRNINDDNNGNNNESIAKRRNNYSSEELQFLSPGVKGPPRSKSRQSESPTHSCLFLAKNGNLNKENGNENEREYESSKNKKNNSVRLINFAVHTLQTILIVLSDAINISIAIEEITLVLSEIIHKIQDIPIKTRLNSFKILNNTFSRISVLLIPLGEENQLIGAILGKFLQIFENENFENSPIVAPKGKNGKIVRVENYENFTVSVSTFMEDEFQRLSL